MCSQSTRPRLLKPALYSCWATGGREREPSLSLDNCGRGCGHVFCLRTVSPVTSQADSSEHVWGSGLSAWLTGGHSCEAEKKRPVARVHSGPQAPDAGAVHFSDPLFLGAFPTSCGEVEPSEVLSGGCNLINLALEVSSLCKAEQHSDAPSMIFRSGLFRNSWRMAPTHSWPVCNRRTPS